MSLRQVVGNIAQGKMNVSLKVFLAARNINFGRVNNFSLRYHCAELCVCSILTLKCMQTRCTQTLCQVPSSLLKLMLTTWIILLLAPVISWLGPLPSALQSTSTVLAH